MRAELDLHGRDPKLRPACRRSARISKSESPVPGDSPCRGFASAGFASAGHPGQWAARLFAINRAFRKCRWKADLDDQALPGLDRARAQMVLNRTAGALGSVRAGARICFGPPDCPDSPLQARSSTPAKIADQCLKVVIFHAQRQIIGSRSLTCVLQRVGQC